MRESVERADRLEEANVWQGGRPDAAAALRPRLKTYAGIFLTSAAVLLFELALTRIFAVVLWAHLAFMVIGNALFGFGLSGVFLAVRRRQTSLHLGALCAYMGAAMLGAYAVVLIVPFRMWYSGWVNYVYLAVWYLALVVPFFFAGLIIAELLRGYPRDANRLYGVDLLGAACGSILLIPLLPLAAGEGVVVSAVLLAMLAGFMLTATARGRRRFAVLSVLMLALVPFAPRLMPVKLHQKKRLYNRAVEKGLILATRWSALSRVDIAKHYKNYRAVWIDGGTNESVMYKITDKIDTLPPWSKDSIGVAYRLKRGTDPNVLIIGPSGGKEVIYAVTNGAKHVDAVELDPSIVKFMNTPRFMKFMGGLYQHPRVSLINDEGRAYMRRQPPGSYDVIQFVNNYTPVAIGSGALNLTETFLLTKEAIIEYWNRLKPDGILALHRGTTLRLALTITDALRDIGVQDPQNHLMIMNGEFPYFQGLLLKKGAWTEAEQGVIDDYIQHIYRKPFSGQTFLWTPFDAGRDTIYAKLLQAGPQTLAPAYTGLGLNLFPATDDKPFLEHYLQIGSKELDPSVPEEFKNYNQQKWRGVVPQGDFPYLMILMESAVLGLLFVGLPLLLRARKSLGVKGFWGYAGYYSALGFGFIVVEICLMKRYVLFLGNPVYSLTTILVVLLLGAGCGSIASERLVVRTRRGISGAVLLVAAALALEAVLAPRIFEAFLHLPFAGRIAVAACMLFPLGFVMGMPFALGLRLISERHPDESERRRMMAWAWGLNGYMTVVGSAATVFVALQVGFKGALVLGIAAYLLGLVALLAATGAKQVSAR